MVEMKDLDNLTPLQLKECRSAAIDKGLSFQWYNYGTYIEDDKLFFSSALNINDGENTVGSFSEIKSTTALTDEDQLMLEGELAFLYLGGFFGEYK